MQIASFEEVSRTTSSLRSPFKPHLLCLLSSTRPKEKNLSWNSQTANVSTFTFQCQWSVVQGDEGTLDEPKRKRKRTLHQSGSVRESRAEWMKPRFFFFLFPHFRFSLQLENWTLNCGTRHNIIDIHYSIPESFERFTGSQDCSKAE